MAAPRGPPLRWSPNSLGWAESKGPEEEERHWGRNRGRMTGLPKRGLLTERLPSPASSRMPPLPLFLGGTPVPPMSATPCTDFGFDLHLWWCVWTLCNFCRWVTGNTLAVMSVCPWKAAASPPWPVWVTDMVDYVFNSAGALPQHLPLSLVIFSRTDVLDTAWLYSGLVVL